MSGSDKFSNINSGALAFPKSFSNHLSYGTAGFRTKADILGSVMYRMGLLAALRSCYKKTAIGVMVTASHNPVQDNGVKLIDPNGEMLAIEWEKYATALANLEDEKVVEYVKELINTYSINTDIKPIIFIGQDTRPSSQELTNCVLSGAKAMGAELDYMGVVSTPVVHFSVFSFNNKCDSPTLNGYINKMTEAFNKLHSKYINKDKPKLYFDGANGVGSMMMEKMQPHLHSLDISIFNKGEGILNFQCGADYVKTSQTWPENVPRTPRIRCASVDGDADRIIYSYIEEDGSFVMLDGDKIAVLIAGYIKNLITKGDLNLNVGIVQTAYANGASTKYIQDQLQIPITCTKTGVKYLHEAAIKYDIGIYFEANGHGTVIFSEKTKEVIQLANDSGNEFATELQCAMNIINETVGDAISDMLIVEIILITYGWSEQKWNEAYTDLPNKLTKAVVPDRNLVTTTNAERTCVTPVALQDRIDELVGSVDCGRSFVRPSGTEDIVRIYAEAITQTAADKLAKDVGNTVKEF